MREILEERVNLSIAEAARRMKISRQALHADRSLTALVLSAPVLRT
jgi:predicted DNA-binding protein (UPF0251 family)